MVDIELLRNDLYNGPLKDDLLPLLESADDRAVSKMYNTKTAASMTLIGILSLLSEESIQKLVVNPNLTDIRDKISEQDFIGVQMWGQMLVAGSQITTEEYANIVASIESLPMSRAEELFGRGATITPEDVGSAR